jgi:hypothetical protein
LDYYNTRDLINNVHFILQTSSVSEFNKAFAAIEVHKTLDDLHQSSFMYVKSSSYTPNDVLAVAEAQYLRFFKKGERTGAMTLGKYATLPAHNWSNAKLQK